MGLQSKPTPITILSETNRTYDVVSMSVHIFSLRWSYRKVNKKEYADPHHEEAGHGGQYFVHTER